MKRTLLSFAAVALPASWLAAALPQELSVSSDLTYTSRYVFRGIQLAGNSFQPNIEAAAGDMYAGIWTNLPLEAADAEINYYAGMAVAAPEIDFFTLDVGLTVYHYPKTGSNRTHEFFLGALLPELGTPRLGASLYYFHDIDLRSHVAEAALTYSFSLEGTGAPASLDLSLLGGLQGGNRSDIESFNYYGASIELPFYLNDHATITPAVHYATAEKYSFGPGERGKNLYWSISYAASF